MGRGLWCQKQSKKKGRESLIRRLPGEGEILPQHLHVWGPSRGITCQVRPRLSRAVQWHLLLWQPVGLEMVVKGCWSWRCGDCQGRVFPPASALTAQQPLLSCCSLNHSGALLVWRRELIYCIHVLAS